MKTCLGCNVVKDEDEFYPAKKGLIQSRCKPCFSVQVETARLKRKYGMTPEDRVALLAAQGGVCATCGGYDEKARWPGTFHQDHCHTANLPRGLLCSSCNLVLGKVSDSEDVLLRMVEYLRFWRTQHQERVA